jgi:hypothetical protein
MKRKHLIIIGIGLVVWLAETAAFGWNRTPHSYAEARWDGLGVIIILWGVIGDVLSNVEFHKNYYKYKETNIKTKTVSINGYSKTGTARPVNVDKSLTESDDAKA